VTGIMAALTGLGTVQVVAAPTTLWGTRLSGMAPLMLGGASLRTGDGQRLSSRDPVLTDHLVASP